ncbi:hypothetical protein SAMN05421759_1055 [Roseivivax lentus]|uniref:Uncharacterized protein n=1 Tax=Roseivivax lentus TaxID=633194 RepID=A0A1N7MMN1_9RHOB|nr:hypothetical protein [Roseivivax lentus]SIS87290.1 hypothetical protein SAMN05421759_1055 [Roseivivax lentus]
MTKRLLPGLLVLVFSAPQVHATGNQFGWCQGVGNKHAGANCGAPQTPDTGGTSTPTVPTSNQLPPMGGQTATSTQLPALVPVSPNPLDTFTGLGPVPQGTPGPGISGTGAVPTPVPQAIPGQVPMAIPSPQPVAVPPMVPQIIVQSVPGQTITGFGPVPQGTTGPGVSGVGAVPTPVPQAIPGQVPMAIPSPQPVAVPPMVPQIIVQSVPGQTITGFGPVPQGTPGPGVSGVGAVPTPVPQAIPGQVPMAIPSPQPVAVPMQIPPITGQATPPGTALVTIQRPRPRPQIVVATPQSATQVRHAPQPVVPPLASQHITRSTGRQAAHAEPRFASRDDGPPWSCIASGHGKRRSAAGDETATEGALRHAGSVDLMARDLPALHPRHADCLISVRRRAR